MATPASRFPLLGVELAFMSANDPEKWNTYFVAATLGVVVFGLIPVVMTARRIYAKTKFRMGRLSQGEVTALVTIGALYAALILVPLVTSRVESQ